MVPPTGITFALGLEHCSTDPASLGEVSRKTILFHSAVFISIICSKFRFRWPHTRSRILFFFCRGCELCLTPATPSSACGMIPCGPWRRGFNVQRPLHTHLPLMPVCCSSKKIQLQQYSYLVVLIVVLQCVVLVQCTSSYLFCHSRSAARARPVHVTVMCSGSLT